MLHMLDSDQRAEIIDDIRKQAKKDVLNGSLEFYFGIRPEIKNLK